MDIGLSAGFDVATTFADSLIDSLTWAARSESEDGGVYVPRPAAEVEVIRTRDQETLGRALTAEVTVLHLLSHGRAGLQEAAFESDDGRTAIMLSRLADILATEKLGIGAWVVFADCCDAARKTFIRALRDCLDHELVYIGATKTVSWHECTLFASIFYGSFFRDKGKGLDPAERGLIAAERAIAAYGVAVDGRCPFRVDRIAPSRRARAALRSA